MLTLNSFIPSDQDQKIAEVPRGSERLRTALNPSAQQPPPSDQAVVAAIRNTADELSRVAGNQPGADCL